MRLTLALATLLCLAIILFGINRGFDVTDEGMYLLLLDPLQENQAGVYNYDLFFKLLYKTTGIEFGIVGSRVLRLFTYVVAAFSLTLFWKNLNQKPGIDWQMGLVFLLGLFSGYAFLPLSLSYNSLSVALACSWLLLLSYRTMTSSKLLLLGLVLAGMVYVKITAAVCLGVSSVVLLAWRKDLTLKSVLLIIFPLVVLELVFLISLEESAVYRFKESWMIMGARPDYQWDLLIKSNWVGVFWVLLVALPSFLISKFTAGAWRVLFLAPIIAGVFVKTMITDEWSHVFLLITAGLLGFLAGRQHWLSFSKFQIQLLILLLILPFLLHFGSNVYWLRLGIHYWVFWVLAVLFFAQGSSAQTVKLQFFVPIVSVLLVFNGIWWKPFGSLGLWHFNEQWEYSPGKHILLTHEMNAILHDLQGQLAAISDEKTIAVYRNPGWLYLLNRTSPTCPGYWDKEQLRAIYPDFPRGFDGILYFPYQDLPNKLSEDFEEKEYNFAQGSLKLVLRKFAD